MKESSDTEVQGVLQGRTYYVEVKDNSGTYMLMGQVVSPGVMFRGTRYWALYGHAVIYLVDPEDVIDLKEVKPYA